MSEMNTGALIPIISSLIIVFLALYALGLRSTIRLLEKEKSDWKVRAIANEILLAYEKRKCSAIESEFVVKEERKV